MDAITAEKVSMIVKKLEALREQRARLQAERKALVNSPEYKQAIREANKARNSKTWQVLRAKASFTQSLIEKGVIQAIAKQYGIKLSDLINPNSKSLYN